MKRSSITMIFGICVFFGFSQNGHNPPRNVSQSFQKEYPQSKPSQWSSSAGGGWSATFEDKDHNNGEATAYFDQKGRHVDTHIPYDNQDVPKPVRDHVKSSYAGSDNNDFTRIDRPGEQSVYMTNVKDNKKSRTVYTDDAGHEKSYTDQHH
jgi:hypothetical protein